MKTTETYNEGYTRCPKCESDNIIHESNDMFGEQTTSCSDCGYILFYYCKADDKEE